MTMVAAARKRRMNAELRSERAGSPDLTPIAFFCECGAEDCLHPVWLTAAEYDRGRADADRAVLAPGHAAHSRSAA